MEAPMRRLSILLTILFLLLAPVAAAARPASHRHLTTIKKELAKHRKPFFSAIELRSGKKLLGVVAHWNNEKIILRESSSHKLQIIPLTDITELASTSPRELKVAETKKHLRDLSMGMIDLFAVITTGKRLTEERSSR
jgi:hypothetical protein